MNDNGALRRVLHRRDREIHDLRSFTGYVMTEIRLRDRDGKSAEEVIEHIREYYQIYIANKDYR